MSNPLTDGSPSALIAAMEANQESVALRWSRLLVQYPHTGQWKALSEASPGPPSSWEEGYQSKLNQSMDFALGGELHVESERTWFCSGFPYHLFNGVIRTQCSPERVDDAIKEMLKYFSERGIPFAWLISPSTQPGDLSARLESHGLRLDDDGPGMAIDLLALPEQVSMPTGLQIIEVTTGEQLQRWLRTLALANDVSDAIVDIFIQLYRKYGFVRDPSNRYYLALLDGEPVATSQLFLADGVAGIYNVGTVSQARRRGIGSAVTLAPLQTARESSYRFGVLQATAMGYPVYEKLGFREYCRFRLYFS